MDTVTQQDRDAARELLAFFDGLRVRPHGWAALPLVARPAVAVRVLVRHAARCAIGDAAAALVIRPSQKRPIGIHPIGRFVFGAA